MGKRSENSSSDTKLFMSLTLSCQKDIYVYILSLVVCPSSAEDILQETLTVMWRKFDEFESGTNFVAWGKQIARYKVMDFISKNKRMMVHFDSDVLELIEAKYSQIDNQADRKEALKKCLLKLTDKQLSLLKLRHGSDMSLKQVGLQFGITKQSVYRLMSNIYGLLSMCVRDALKPEGGEHGI